MLQYSNILLFVHFTVFQSPHLFSSYRTYVTKLRSDRLKNSSSDFSLFSHLYFEIIFLVSFHSKTFPKIFQNEDEVPLMILSVNNFSPVSSAWITIISPLLEKLCAEWWWKPLFASWKEKYILYPPWRLIPTITSVFFLNIPGYTLK